MNRDEFETLLLIHGGDAGRWPEDARQSALDLVATDAEAARMLDTARRSDEIVLVASAVGPSGALAARIVAATGGDEQAIFNVTPAGIAGALAGSLGIAGVGYVASAAIAGVIVPAALIDTVSLIVSSSVAGGF